MHCLREVALARSFASSAPGLLVSADSAARRQRRLVHTAAHNHSFDGQHLSACRLASAESRLRFPEGPALLEIDLKVLNQFTCNLYDYCVSGGGRRGLSRPAPGTARGAVPPCHEIMAQRWPGPAPRPAGAARRCVPPPLPQQQPPPPQPLPQPQAPPTPPQQPQPLPPLPPTA